MKRVNKYISVLLIVGFMSTPCFAEEYNTEEQVYHVVLVWLKTYRNEMRINKIIEAIPKLMI